MSKSILIVEDEETLRESLKRIFAKDGFSVDAAESAEEGLQLLETNIYDVIISDIILPGIDGIEMLSKVRKDDPDQVFIVMTAYASLDTAVKALRAGAYDYIMKPVMHEEIKQVVRNAIRQRRLQIENLLLKRELGKSYDFSSVIGKSAELNNLLDEVKKIADTKSNVLLLGETGTGKELFARVIHNNSSRKNMPFIPINCSVIPENLLESELFGHQKGAFTGAVLSKKGLFEEADGGTIFLDEIGDITPFIQIKLLRVLEAFCHDVGHELAGLSLRVAAVSLGLLVRAFYLVHVAGVVLRVEEPPPVLDLGVTVKIADPTHHSLPVESFIYSSFQCQQPGAGLVAQLAVSEDTTATHPAVHTALGLFADLPVGVAELGLGKGANAVSRGDGRHVPPVLPFHKGRHHLGFDLEDRPVVLILVRDQILAANMAVDRAGGPVTGRDRVHHIARHVGDVAGSEQTVLITGKRCRIHL